jgi:inosine-uridine nucleoside N-ribohydrolase
MTSQPLLLDVDTGVDDALAVMLALASPEVKLIGITTVSGNAPVEVCTGNTLLVLDRACAPDIPVVRGAARPLAGPPRHAERVHGHDGLGDTTLPRDVARRDCTAGAADFLLSSIDAWRGELVAVATGPLTNIALALQKDPGRLQGLRRLIVMGGAVGVAGNVTPAAEFNIWADPEAAAQVLAAGLPLTLVPLDVTEQVVLRRETVEGAAARGPRQAFVRDITAFAMAFHRREEGLDGMFLHDPLAVAAVLDPTLLGRETLRLAVERRGEHTAGMTLADRRRRRRTGDRVEVCTTVRAERFERLFGERVLGEIREA